MRQQINNEGYVMIEAPEEQDISLFKLFGQWSGTISLADMAVIFYLLGTDQNAFETNKKLLFNIVQYCFVGKTVGDTGHAVREYNMGTLTKMQVAELGSQWVNTMLLMNAVNRWVGPELTGPFSFEYISAMNMLFAALKENAFQELRTYLALATDTSIAVSVFVDFIAPLTDIAVDPTVKDIASLITAGLGLMNVLLNTKSIAPQTFEVAKRAGRGVYALGCSVGRGLYSLFHRSEEPVAAAQIARSDSEDSEQQMPNPYRV
ncbi:MAG: hypothetical protein SFW66_09730 [Gammaproteobacteria bacterium]|nr:hypothetical protein [Gammaproteobacteria bacterium]